MACMCNLMRKCVTAVWQLLQWLRYFSTVCAQCSIGICSARAIKLLRAWRVFNWGVLWDAHLSECYYVTTTVCVLAPAKRCERCVFASAAAAAAVAAAAAATITAVVVVCVHRHLLNQYCYYYYSHRLYYTTTTAILQMLLLLPSLGQALSERCSCQVQCLFEDNTTATIEST
eukprot:1494-Heterococcus_DN1.PRE.3